MKRGKKIINAREKVDKTKLYELDEAIALLKEVKYANYDESVDLAVKVVHKSFQNIRGVTVLPFGTGKKKKILAICKGPKQDEAKEAGADYVGAEDIIEKIKGGWIDFQAVVATPDMMKEVGKLGPILGKKGLMPKPKSGTVTLDLKGIISELQGGRIDYRCDKTGVIHLGVGKVSFENNSLVENVKTVYGQLVKDKPADAKGNYIKSFHLSSSMGPGIKINYKGISK